MGIQLFSTIYEKKSKAKRFWFWGREWITDPFENLILKKKVLSLHQIFVINTNWYVLSGIVLNAVKST